MSALAAADFEARLKTIAFFHGLENAAVRAIAKHAHLRALRASQVLWRQGEHAYELALVWSGQLNVIRQLEGDVTFRAVRINEIIGLSNSMGLTPCTVDVVAAEATQVLLVPGEVLRSLVPRFPEIAFRAIDHMGRLLGKISDDVEKLHHSPLERRILDRLRLLSAKQREVHLTHQQLANQVAAKRESVSRVLAQLAKQGRIRAHRGRIEVLDLDAT